MTKGKRNVLIAVTASVILILAYLASNLINIKAFVKSDVNDDLTEEERGVLAEEFEMKNVEDKIAAASYSTNSMRLEVKYFGSCEEMFEQIEFKSEDAKTNALRWAANLDLYVEPYKDLEGNEIKVFTLNHSRFLAGDQCVDINLFYDENGYGFIAEKGEIVNEETCEIIKEG